MTNQNQSSNQNNRLLARLASVELDLSESERSLFSSVRSGLGIDMSERSAASEAPDIAASSIPLPPPTGYYRHNPSSFSSSEAPDENERRDSNFSLATFATVDESIAETAQDSSVQSATALKTPSPVQQQDRENESDDGNSNTPVPQKRAGVSFSSQTRNLETDSIQYGIAANFLYRLREASDRSLVKEASARSLLKVPRDSGAPAVTTAVVTKSNNEDLDVSNHSLVGNGIPSTVKSRSSDKYYDLEEEANSDADLPPPPATKGVLKNKGKTGPIRKKRLSKLSAQYDLDGDGVLDPIEQAMRDRDIDGDGQLDNEEIYRIVQDQLKSQKDVYLYRKVASGLACLVCILALSNFGTSWATAILSRETVADTETSTIQSKSPHEVMGFQEVSHEIDLEPLTDEEFEERRLLVDLEMEEDPDHEDHIHQRLGRKDKNHVCTCSKIAYDHNKLKESDLMELIRKCDGSNTVSIKRKWKNSDTYDIDTICGPGTNVVKKGKKKNNKKKTKTKYVEDQVKFRRKGNGGQNGGRDQEISFDCKNGYCYGSGQTLLQQEGHPCNVDWDRDGAGECDDGLVCYDSDGRGTGTCTLLVRYAQMNQVCDIDFGVDACESGYACYSATKKRSTLMGVVNTGTCKKLAVRVGNQDVCDASYGRDACDTGFTCIGENGLDLNGYGIGYCQRLVQKQRSGGLCDLSLGWDACDAGFYCRDSMLTRSGGNGAGNAWTGAIISGPSGTVGGQTGIRGRTSGTGTCAITLSRGDTCESDDECGWNGTCVGLGADTATGGVIRGASGTIVWGTGGATTGICG